MGFLFYFATSLIDIFFPVWLEEWAWKFDWQPGSETTCLGMLWEEADM